MTTTWPDSVQIKQNKSSYSTPDGDFPRITTVLRVLGLGKDHIINWAASQEREAVILAALPPGQATRESIMSRLGDTKAHVRALAKAGEIGLEVHGRASWLIKAQLGEVQTSCPALTSEPAEIAFMAWEEWWKGAGLTPLKSEQIVWDPDWGFAGTIDLIAKDKNGLNVIVDLKTSKYTYPEHHLQVAAYWRAAQRWMPIHKAILVRLPKSVGDSKFEVVELGKLPDRNLSLMELQINFRAALTLYNSLVGRVND